MDNIELTINMIVQNNADTIENTLKNIEGVADEIVIVDGGSTDETISICKKYTDKLFFRTFDNDFSAQKNYANTVSMGRWIFNIDSDELMSDILKSSLREIIHTNDRNNKIDLIWIPRINKVSGLEQRHIENWGWTVDEDNHINWPDWQGRLYRHKPGLLWTGAVHERVEGFRNFGRLPSDKSYGLYLIHLKDIVTQEKQNASYANIRR